MKCYIWADPCELLFVILRFILLAVAPALSSVLFQAGWRRLGHGRWFPLPQQLPLPLHLLTLRVDLLLLPRTQTYNQE